MISRRNLIVSAAALAALPRSASAMMAIPAGNRLGFDVVRKGSKLGSHVLTFEQRGNELTVHITVELAYKILGVTLYRYSHHATESWVGDVVVGLESTTDDNGSRYRLSGRRGAAGFVVEGTGVPRFVAPANAMPATHWNHRELDGPWINTQDGRIMRPRVAPQGVETIPTANGGVLRARHFALTGDVMLDMFYDDRLGWAGLSFVKGGAPVRYERQG